MPFSSRSQNRVIHFGGRERQAGLDVFGFQITDLSITRGSGAIKHLDVYP